MNRDQIRATFLRNGFTIKDGNDDLKEYVYAAAEELLQAAFVDQHAGTSDTVPVNSEALYKILNALQGHQHQILELYALKNSGLPGYDCPIKLLTEQYNRWLDVRLQSAGAIDHDTKSLTRELDVLLNGKEVAAEQASLCDLVAQLRAVVRRTGRLVLTTTHQPKTGKEHE